MNSQIQVQQTEKKQNPMTNPKLTKIILSCGATGTELEKAILLLKTLSNKKPKKVASTKRIPNFGVRPGLEVGACVTLRNKEATDLLKRFLTAVDNSLSKKQISDNHFSFGIHEYIEIPGTEYKREIGIRGLSITVVFERPGMRVKRKKIKKGKIPKKQFVTKEEIIKYMEKNFKTKFTGK